MRTRIVFPIILFAGLILLLAGWFRPQPGRPVSLPAATASGPPAMSSQAVQAAVFKETLPPPVPIDSPAAPPAMVGAEPDGQDMDGRITRLEALAMNNDAGSLNLILQSLTDANPQIRAAALEATVQFDSPEAIPTLQYALAKAELPQEKVNIQEAIDFLKLPPLALDDSRSP